MSESDSDTRLHVGPMRAFAGGHEPPGYGPRIESGSPGRLDTTHSWGSLCFTRSVGNGGIRRCKANLARRFHTPRRLPRSSFRRACYLAVARAGTSDWLTK